jgi:hydrogenase maturation protease
MKTSFANVLILCYGNPGRLDDGLGAAFAARIQNKVPADVVVEVDYLITVEHAADIAESGLVIFVDAALTGAEPFSFRRVKPLTVESFSSHVIEPGSVLGLAKEVFEADTPGYCLAIRGYEFDAFGETLSPKAEKNLDAALEFLFDLLETREFEAATQGETKTKTSGA